MTEGYEFGGAQFLKTEPEWAQSAVVTALDHVDVLGHTAFRCARSVILNRTNEWWVIKFERVYEVHPFFSQVVILARRKEKKKVQPFKEKNGYRRIINALRWLQDMDCKLFPPDGYVDVNHVDLGDARIFRGPVCFNSYYAITKHGIYRVIDEKNGLNAELYEVTEERVEFVESLTRGRSVNQSPMSEWFVVADFL